MLNIAQFNISDNSQAQYTTENEGQWLKHNSYGGRNKLQRLAKQPKDWQPLASPPARVYMQIAR